MSSSRQFFSCGCMSQEHTLVFDYSNFQGEPPELYSSVFLNQPKNLFQRIWTAIKYVLGYKCKYGHWDCCILKAEDVPRFQEMLKNFTIDSEKYWDECVRKNEYNRTS